MLPPSGTDKRVVFAAAKKLPVWLYQPTSVSRSDRIIVAVHGVSREHLHQLEAYKCLADKMGYRLLVPEFSRSAFPRYQQLAKDSGSPRADLALNTVLVALKVLLQQPFLKMHLCGYSGGAQFSHRYALLHPQNVASLVLCSAGWYSFPDRRVAYPYGIADWPHWLGKLRIEEMLKLPTLVTVGEADVKREKSLRQSASLDAQQGVNRVERAESWVAAMDRRRRQLSAREIELCHLPDIGHDFQKSVSSSEMMNYIETFWNELERNKVCAA